MTREEQEIWEIQENTIKIKENSKARIGEFVFGNNMTLLVEKHAMTATS